MSPSSAPWSGRHVWFTGFMATGKSRLGSLVADQLGIPFEDTDHWIEARHRRTVQELFHERGEAAFRELEWQAVQHLASESPRVIALGGGTLLHPHVAPLVHQTGVLVGLWAAPEAICNRVGRKDSRPLLAGLSFEDRLERIRSMLADRAPLYAAADVQVESRDDLPREELARRLAQLARRWSAKSLRMELGLRSYPILAGAGLWKNVPSFLEDLGLRGPRVVVSERGVHGVQGAAIDVLASNLEAPLFLFEGGEERKTLAEVARLWEWLGERGLGRDTILLAASGGVVGDMAGFAAAAWHRGSRWVQLPTTLLAMVDSSVGGKTGVNLPFAKNMVGAFHQPSLVVADTDILSTLPLRELRAGLAEVAKYALIRDPALGDWLEAHAADLLAGNPHLLAEAVRRSCRHKAAVVGADERETGPREVLNLGHTFGHALETLGHYNLVLHGEAVALGIRCACRLSSLAGLWDPVLEIRVQRLLDTLDLPRRWPAGQVDREAARRAMSRDKKVRDGKIRLVVPIGEGEVAVRADLDPLLVDRAWEAIEGP